MRLALLHELQSARRQRRSFVLATWLGDGSQCLLSGDTEPHVFANSCESAEVVAALSAEVSRVLARDCADVVTCRGSEVLLEPHLPPLHLILIGAVHIAHPLTEMASLAGFAVTIVDPRRAFASDSRFPGQTLIVQWPDEALRTMALDRRTAVVTLTHDPKLDDPAIEVALRHPVFYIGCLGSKKTHASRLLRLRDCGFFDVELARLHGPVGLPIGARSPAEIAVSILAEMIGRLRTMT